MVNKGSLRTQMYTVCGLLLFALTANAVDTNNSTDSTQDKFVLSQLKITRTGNEETIHSPEIFGEKPFTLKTDPTTGQVHFNTTTVDISVVNQQKDREIKEKVAIVQKDLESRITLTGPDQETVISEDQKIEKPTDDPIEVIKKEAKVKEDLESRIVPENNDKRYRVETHEFYDDYRNPVKRADVDYYGDEEIVDVEQPPESTPIEAPKEEESFFSIFESLFGMEEDDSKNKKVMPEERTSAGGNLKENIKTVGEILKPVKASEKPQVKRYDEYQDPQEYRIINEYPQKQGIRPSEQYQYQYQTQNSVKPYQQFRPYPMPGYEDYDVEEFVDKQKDKPTTEKIAITVKMTTPSTTTLTSMTRKHFFNTPRPKFPEKKGDLFKPSATERMTEKPTYYTIKPSTERHHHEKPNYEAANQIKPEKIQDSANFYNFLNLPVQYSTKDTAIPLISTSYANTKIQGMGAHKYDKLNNGKYPNHKYDTANSVKTTTTTRRPSYWSARRTTQGSTTASTSKAPPPKIDLEYDELALGTSANFGGFGNKASATVSSETKPPYADNTTKRIFELTKKKNEPNKYKTQTESTTTKEKTTIKIIPTPANEYAHDYDSVPATVQEVKPPKNSSSNRLHSSYSEKNKIYSSNAESTYKKTFEKTSTTTTKTTMRKTTTTTTTTEPPKEELEYEYYDYETDAPSPPTTTTTPPYRVKYPGLQKEKIKTTSEKIAVIIPTNNEEFFGESMKVKTTTAKEPSQASTFKTTTTTTSTPTISTTREPIRSEGTNNVKVTYNFYRPKEPAPVFEENDESGEYTPGTLLTPATRRTTTEKGTTTQVKPIIVTATKKDQENNVNIVLVPMKEPQKETQLLKETTKPRTERPSTTTDLKTHTRQTEAHHHSFDYTTEFTVGVLPGQGSIIPSRGTNSVPIHGHGGSVPVQGHFVASTLIDNPYGEDEPFRPIPKPQGFSTSFKVVANPNDLRKPDVPIIHADRKTPTKPNLEESELAHEPHEFIPSPQFHRPGESKVQSAVPSGLSGISIDYDFDGIQTEPRPGQYVIFSKPQLNPELNEGHNKRPEAVTAKIPAAIYHEGVNKYPAESQKHVVYSPKPGQYYTSVPETKPSSSEKPDTKRPNHQIPSELVDERLSLELVPPKGMQTEKPFEGNFVTPENEKTNSAANYPRPHWEKNGKPSFLLNTPPNKIDVSGSRPPLLPPQMAPTLIPPGGTNPQRFRKPLPPHMPPIRKNFNEGNMNTKPKPNLPNILPQFRPNAKIGTGSYQRPYHRPQGGYMNRRNGSNRYHEKDIGFPYHIHHPTEKGGTMIREFEVESDFYPKFITNRGKASGEILEPHVMHKRYGDSPPDVLAFNPGADNPKRRLQRTPVTTLQMLKQTPGVRTHKNPVLREDSENPLVPIVPPVYQPYKEKPIEDKNVHLVYPSNVRKSQYPIDHQQDHFEYDFKMSETQYPLLNPTRKANQEKQKTEFPYGFIKPDEKLKLIRKYQEDSEVTKNNAKASNRREDIKPNIQDYMPIVTKKPIPSSDTKDETVDMSLHMQSNNQWNKVTTAEEHVIITEAPKAADVQKEEKEFGPPSEYHTAIHDGSDSAFTLGAVMHTIPETGKKGQVASVSLGDDLNTYNLDVNQRISNGKIVTVSMPLDVKDDKKEEKIKFDFQAPFQASSSISSNGSQGWSVVKIDGENEAEEEKEQDVNGNKTTTKFNFENFKPELIGGFKPIYGLPGSEPEYSTKEYRETREGEKER